MAVFTRRRFSKRKGYATIAKREFKRVLGDNEREAVKAYTKIHADVEREIAEAVRVLEQGRAAERGDPPG